MINDDVHHDDHWGQKVCAFELPSGQHHDVSPANDVTESDSISTIGAIGRQLAVGVGVRVGAGAAAGHENLSKLGATIGSVLSAARQFVYVWPPLPILTWALSRMFTLSSISGGSRGSRALPNSCPAPFTCPVANLGAIESFKF